MFVKRQLMVLISLSGDWRINVKFIYANARFSTMLGDALYLEYINEVLKNKHEKDLSSSDEFQLQVLKDRSFYHLSKKWKSLCVYYGEDEWDGPLSLTQYVMHSRHLTPLVSDYKRKMNLG